MGRPNQIGGGSLDISTWMHVWKILPAFVLGMFMRSLNILWLTVGWYRGHCNTGPHIAELNNFPNFIFCLRNVWSSVVETAIRNGVLLRAGSGLHKKTLQTVEEEMKHTLLLIKFMNLCCQLKKLVLCFMSIINSCLNTELCSEILLY
jgi:hypothetical protein